MNSLHLQPLMRGLETSGLLPWKCTLEVQMVPALIGLMQQGSSLSSWHKNRTMDLLVPSWRSSNGAKVQMVRPQRTGQVTDHWMKSEGIMAQILSL